MTTVVIHGAPGSCKTATAVWEFAIPALKAGRTVCTNIRGLTVEQVKTVFPDLPDTANIINYPLTPEGYEKAARFFHDAPLGALILLDEIQKIYPSKVRNSAVYDCEPPRELPETAMGETISSVETAFDQHRHLNWDIVGTCPNISQVAGFVRDVVEVAYRQRPMSGVLPFMGNRIKRIKHQAVSNGFVNSYILGSEFVKIDPRVFECYRSTATGEIKHSADKFSITSQPKLMLALFAVIACVLYLGFNNPFMGTDSQLDQNLNKKGDAVSFKVRDQVTSVPDHIRSKQLSIALPDHISDVVSRLKYYAGNYAIGRRKTFILYGDDIRITSQELFAMGFKLSELGKDYIALEYNEQTFLYTQPFDYYAKYEHPKLKEYDFESNNL